jgi:hypothetical protein
MDHSRRPFSEKGTVPEIKTGSSQLKGMVGTSKSLHFVSKGLLGRSIFVPSAWKGQVLQSKRLPFVAEGLLGESSRVPSTPKEPFE